SIAWLLGRLDARVLSTTDTPSRCRRARRIRDLEPAWINGPGSKPGTLQQRNAELERAIAHLREVDQLKSNFLATVSHELRTPLTSIIGFSEMLAKGIAGPLNEEQTEYANTILERGEEL